MFWPWLRVILPRSRLHFTHTYSCSIICLFRTTVWLEENFGLDRVRITDNLKFSLNDWGWSVQANFNDLNSLDHVVECTYTQNSWIIMSQTVNTTTWHNNCISLTLSLPIFWQICFLSATFISVMRGIMSYDASTYSKILMLYVLLLITSYEFPKSDLSKNKNASSTTKCL